MPYLFVYAGASSVKSTKKHVFDEKLSGFATFASDDLYDVAPYFSL